MKTTYAIDYAGPTGQVRYETQSLPDFLLFLTGIIAEGRRAYGIFEGGRAVDPAQFDDYLMIAAQNFAFERLCKVLDLDPIEAGRRFPPGFPGLQRQQSRPAGK